MLKFDAEKYADFDFGVTFWLDFLSGSGGKGGGWIQAKTSGWLQLSFHTPCTPGRGAADEKAMPKWIQKRAQNRGLGDQGSDFWGFGRVFEEFDFWEFSSGEKSA